MHATHPSHYITRFIKLPLSRLHIIEAGEGEPLVIVPATISELENWIDLIQFMAQWFHVYFFELPGHGQSSPFQDGFSSEEVAKLVEQLVDEEGFDHFNLMGFSFGGILAMQTFKRLSHRVNRLVMIAPCVDHRAIPYSPLRLSIIYNFNQFVSRPTVHKYFNNLLHNKYSVHLIVKALQKIGHLERTLELEKKLQKTPESTLAVLNAQVNEILTMEFDIEPKRYETPCYFAMSINDPLLCFDDTLKVLQNHFANVNTVRLTYPFHQPPRPFTYEEYNRDFYKTIDAYMRKASPIPLSSQ